MKFEELGLSPEVLGAIADAGYTEPTPIQAQAIPHLLMGRDVLGIAQTGTGKTAGFTLPMIEILAAGRARARMPRSLILEPTRELAAQVAENFAIYGKNHKLSMALLIGGVSFVEQNEKLDRGVDVLIATPGRLLDQFERGRILLADIKILVVDEADRMLDMGFIPDVERIIKLLPPIRQTAMFSATMPTEVKRLTDSYMMNPRRVEVAPPASAAETVVQRLVAVRGGFTEKRKALRDLIASENVRNAIVFCNRKRDVKIVDQSLRRHGINAQALHGDLPQPVRTATLEKFRAGEISILVASDVAARGLDIDDMSHVINFDVPMNPEDYIHRIGRTGRAGREGHALTLATAADAKYVQQIERLIGGKIEPINSVVQSADQTQATPPVTPQAERDDSRPRGDAKAPRKRTSNRRNSGIKIAANTDVKPATASKPTETERDKPRRTQRRPQQGEPAELGMGDHTPAFLQR
ncbi:MAG: DEAD/DEAH box helicase [Alphaproteobacteria bacterium]|nr:DEAD/DEAH box helicase [Alphaproteobacteria bacterium]MCZ6588441.1 DEAD/DEAH box helicase [Alphaproteobacteria bacterium]MCZ6592850.1 DEAD/DEAH box helicase [Alphaproteobacteria bacterium]